MTCQGANSHEFDDNAAAPEKPGAGSKRHRAQGEVPGAGPSPSGNRSSGRRQEWRRADERDGGTASAASLAGKQRLRSQECKSLIGKQHLRRKNWAQEGRLGRAVCCWS